ncbi:DNA-binding response regulator, NarL/FixJ family, contains REC and HTH domains [Cyclobacterium xiamenense]|uniref:DNA-binding response regulator, NarL/FixJ family, contains REC and HTH domains n=1 Tax=Cyclobacterium xiamenense TaxID=1297121 RepID=A0A1H6WBJ7_9BACT|nr:response regulator transcription factor [Cyclobacterium xiamenense]SEJ10200.1 DNA-binding response regulator, NarL/FixJ family, contains REC and HTH domains [Cyclobacterium xiamenense]
MTTKTKIVLADDHKLFAAGIENLLSREEDFQVEGVYHNGKELLEALETIKADLLITDMNMPGLNGLGILQHIKKKRWKIKTIVLSMYDEEEIFKKCIQQGVDAYVLKNADPDELIFTIREVMEERYLANFEQVLKQAEEDEFDQYDHFKTAFKLSKRELEILKWIARGKSNKEIADQLYLSVFTVETHRKHLHRKLEVSSMAELVKKALEMGLG